MSSRRVAVVTGGGGGIGAAIAEELGRLGAFVVTLDPLVSVDGAEQLAAPTQTTAGRIVAAGGAARATSVSVTDARAVRELFDELVAEHGHLDAVVNVAGITRPTGFARGDEADWRRVLEVHLDGYRNVVAAALPLMAAAGSGSILGVTSGSGWRAADAGAYSAAKRAVAALTWQLGRVAPAGVSVNAISPIAATRMVAAAMARARPAGEAGAASASGGLSLSTGMPEPEALGPLAAHLVSEAAGWCRGRVVFAGGSEVAVIDEPRLVEVVRTGGARSVRHVLDEVLPAAFLPAEEAQGTVGASNQRFPAVFAADSEPERTAARCLVVADRLPLGEAVLDALTARGAAASAVVIDSTVAGDVPGDLLAAAVQDGAIDAVVVAVGGTRAGEQAGWQRVLAEHEGIVDRIDHDAAWGRAAAAHTKATRHPLRLVQLIDATTAGGRSRAQAAAQLSRSARAATRDHVAAFAVAIEAPGPDAPVAELAAHLACHPDAAALSGAELAVGDGWVGLRSHPRPIGSITFGGPQLPPWFDHVLRQITGEHT